MGSFLILDNYDWLLSSPTNSCRAMTSCVSDSVFCVRPSSAPENMGVNVRIGGSDRWGNITAGTELIRKIFQVEGVMEPSLARWRMERFGCRRRCCLHIKSYQYFFSVLDVDVIMFMKILTFLSLDEIQGLEESMKKPGYVPNIVQRRLAEEVTHFLIKQGGLYLNNIRIDSEDKLVEEGDIVDVKVLLLSAGNKNKMVVRIS
ncbi:hypothetical protein ABZP36_009287 [Zizania latifolia]